MPQADRLGGASKYLAPSCGDSSTRRGQGSRIGGGGTLRAAESAAVGTPWSNSTDLRNPRITVRPVLEIAALYPDTQRTLVTAAADSLALCCDTTVTVASELRRDASNGAMMCRHGSDGVAS